MLCPLLRQITCSSCSIHLGLCFPACKCGLLTPHPFLSSLHHHYYRYYLTCVRFWAKLACSWCLCVACFMLPTPLAVLPHAITLHSRSRHYHRHYPSQLECRRLLPLFCKLYSLGPPARRHRISVDRSSLECNLFSSLSNKREREKKKKKTF